MCTCMLKIVWGRVITTLSQMLRQDGTGCWDETGYRDETLDTAVEDGVVAAVAMVGDLENPFLSQEKPILNIYL